MLATEEYSSAHEVIEALPGIDKEASHRCGLSYEAYVRFFSSLVDSAVSNLPEEDRASVRSYARTHYEYASPMEIAAENEEMWAEGYCSHGLTEDTCPCGCFEVEDFFAEEDQEPLTLQERISLSVLAAKIEICEMVLAAIPQEDGEASDYVEHISDRLMNLTEDLFVLSQRLQCM